jgi:hypothetical protein
MSEFSNVSLSQISINAQPIPIRDANLQLHLIATTGLFDSVAGGSPVTTNGANVKRWEDQSGKGNHATQTSTLLAPILLQSAQNSLPAIRFSSDAMQLNTFVFGQNGSLFVVFRNNDATFGSLLFTDLSVPPSNYIGIITDSSYNVSGRNKFILSQNDNGNGNSGKLAFSGGLAGSNFIVASCFCGASVTNGGVARLNGVSGVNIGTINNGPSFGQIGGQDSPYELKADIGEMLVYNRVLSESEQVATEQYLNQKWAIY